MASPLISFIIPYHNEPEALLQACLESIEALHLAKEEAEIIVVDDGSSIPLSSPRGTKLVRQEQAGLSVARNTGISQASGRFIQFVDADDCIIPSAYEAVIEQLRKDAADVVMFKMTQHHPSATSMKNIKKSPPMNGESGGSFLLRHNLRAAAWGYAFKRDILGDLRFCPGLIHEDELFTPQLFLKANSLLELNVKAYFYRQHEGSITHSNSSEKIQKRLDDIHFILKELRSLENPFLKRRIRQLTVDYIQLSWTLTYSFKELRRRTKALRQEGFLPLPLRCYSLRYMLGSLLTLL